MANFAADWLAIAAELRHTVFELPFVRIVVATLAVQILPVVGDLRLGKRGLRQFVAIAAGSGEMAPGKSKANLLVARQRESRGREAIQVVTLLAPILIGSTGKLRIVLVLVAVHALGKLDLVLSVFAFGDVTLRTFESRVLALQRIS